jgi:putative FmdB family regulatory protein
MPTYEYECKTCSHRFDAFQAISDEPLKVCPECGKEVRRLILGGTGVIFKGSGFYVTDRGGKAGSAKKEVKSAESSASGEAKSADSSGKDAKPADSSRNAAAPDAAKSKPEKGADSKSA